MQILFLVENVFVAGVALFCIGKNKGKDRLYGLAMLFFVFARFIESLFPQLLIIQVALTIFSILTFLFWISLLFIKKKGLK